ncbi:gmc oxidoreductase [Moniliophthora roreri]|uniref:Putative alcohol oxidase n=1 Tax=Moniliophthora roreri TaxID=221103 RepID=A0A0W0FQU0_MONRR|nr:gmc oxidoreductase [Moniliophthora roreri]
MWPKLSQFVAANLVLASFEGCRAAVWLGNLADSYDFIVVGGGQAGLTIASRLSEDSSRTVLVIEAGDSGEAIQSKIDTPSSTYLDSITGTSADWQYTTIPEPNTNNRTIWWPRGKVLGGSSAMNAMYMVRPPQIEVDAWANLMAGESDAASQWNWNSLFAAMKKSETFHPPDEQARQLAQIQYDAGSHGEDGPIQVAYSPFQFEQNGQWIQAMSNAGIWSNPDAMSGRNWGAWTTNSFINPAGPWKRSYSRSAYIDPHKDRPNLTILVNSTVTRILFAQDSNSATGVEYAESRDGDRRTVNVNREVIVTSGAIGTPHVLLASGVGPRAVLEAAGVPVKVDLPGVGEHLQDHLTNSVTWNTSADTAGSLFKSGLRTPEFLSHINPGVAYLNASYLFGGDSGRDEFAQTVANQYSASLSTVPTQSSEIIEGYRVKYDVLSRTVIPSEVGIVELLLNMMGDGSISIGVAMQHPFSQGRLYINSSSVFDPPIIEPNYLAHPSDVVMLRQGLKVARAIGSVAPFNSTLGTELSPGPQVQTDEQWDAWIRGTTWTQFHPGCTCSMLPRNQGGVVDANLKVYGLDNVRVADGSVFPFLFSAHIGAPTYGVAEEASTLIRNSNSALPRGSWSWLGLFAIIGIVLAV